MHTHDPVDIAGISLAGPSKSQTFAGTTNSSHRLAPSSVGAVNYQTSWLTVSAQTGCPLPVAARLFHSPTRANLVGFWD